MLLGEGTRLDLLLELSEGMLLLVGVLVKALVQPLGQLNKELRLVAMELELEGMNQRVYLCACLCFNCLLVNCYPCRCRL